MMPKSPANLAGRITRKFNPFETAGQTMFSNRSVSMQPYPEQMQMLPQMMNQTIQSGHFQSVKPKKHKKRRH